MIAATTKPSCVQCTGTKGSSVKAGLERRLVDVASIVVSGSGTESVTARFLLTRKIRHKVPETTAFTPHLLRGRSSTCRRARRRR